MTPAEFSKVVAGMARRVPMEIGNVAELTGLSAKAKARSLIGQERPEWLALADITIEEKTRLGYVGRVSATDPLLRTGEMRDSIEFEVLEDPGTGVSVAIYSNDEKAVIHELGGGYIPPRPFLATAMRQELPLLSERFSLAAERVFGTK